MVKVAIARNLPDEALIPAFRAAAEGGFTHLEITMNSRSAAQQIRRAVRELGSQIPVGAGTVRNLEELLAALEAGAQFIVTPNTVPEVIQTCVQRGVPVFSGALSPTEVWRAWEAGASLVKVFPVNALGGAAYIRDLLGPFDRVPLLACGGVTPENWPQYKAAGAAGLALGSSLFQSQWIEGGDWEALKRYALSFS